MPKVGGKHYSYTKKGKAAAKKAAKKVTKKADSKNSQKKQKTLPAGEKATPKKKPKGKSRIDTPEIQEKMRELIDLMRDQFDMIIFDSPPTVAVTDAAVLASLMDGIILVIKAGRTPSDLCRRSRALLDKTKTPILGAILNDITPQVGGYYYYYHDRYYHYYTDEGEKKKKRKKVRGSH